MKNIYASTYPENFRSNEFNNYDNEENKDSYIFSSPDEELIDCTNCKKSSCKDCQSNSFKSNSQKENLKTNDNTQNDGLLGGLFNKTNSKSGGLFSNLNLEKLLPLIMGLKNGNTNELLSSLGGPQMSMISSLLGGKNNKNKNTCDLEEEKNITTFDMSDFVKVAEIN